MCWIRSKINTFFKIDFISNLGTLGHPSPPPEMLWLKVHFWLGNQAVKFSNGRNLHLEDKNVPNKVEFCSNIGRNLLKGVKKLHNKVVFCMQKLQI